LAGLGRQKRRSLTRTNPKIGEGSGGGNNKKGRAMAVLEKKNEISGSGDFFAIARRDERRKSEEIQIQGGSRAANYKKKGKGQGFHRAL